MLTKEECEKALVDVKYGFHFKYREFDTFKNGIKVLEQLINEHFDLVEKDTPMKVDVIDLDYGYFDCPKCKGTFWYDGEGIECNYCPDCGQALDLKVEEPSNE